MDLESNLGKEAEAVKTRIFPKDVLTPTTIELVPSMDLECSQVEEFQQGTSETRNEGKQNIRTCETYI